MSVKIVHVDETFHPSYGYHTNPLAKFQRMQGHEVIIVSVDKKWMHPVYKAFGDSGATLDIEDEKYERNTGVRIKRVAAKGYIMKRLIYDRAVFDVVDNENPDIVYVHCVETLTAMRFMLHRGLYPMLFDSHMLSMASVNKFAKIYEYVYRLIFARIIKHERFDVIRTQNDRYVMEHLGIPEEQAPFVSFGTDTELFKPSDIEQMKFREKHGISRDSFVIVYTGKLTPAKGAELLADAFLRRFKCAREIVLLLVGNFPEGEYGNSIKRSFENSPNRIIYFPAQAYQELAQFYQAADLSIFPKQCSLSFYDAQACGLPVLSEDNNVNVDRCSHGNGMNFFSGNIDDFRAKIEFMANMPEEEYLAMREAATRFVYEGYSYTKIADEYNIHINRAIERFASKKKGKMRI